MTDVERRLLLEAFDSNWITPLGPFVDRFERMIAERAGRGHAVALSSGTAALHLALLMAGVKPGDEVLVPSLTFAASANAVVYCGAVPVFVDSEPQTWNIDPALVATELEAARAAGRRVAAVLSVDLYGNCADYDALVPICERYDVPLIADAAEAVGASFGGRPAGSFGRFSAFSFNGNKIVTCGGGGALLLDDADEAARARYLASQARQPVEHYEHTEVGFNYRLSNVLAALGCGQFERLDDVLDKRRAIRARYEALFGGRADIEFAPTSPRGVPNNWLNVVQLQAGESAVLAVIAALRAKGIEARRVWKPMHLQPVFSGHRMVGGAVACRAFAQGVCLPSGTDLNADQQTTIASTVCSVLG